MNWSRIPNSYRPPASDTHLGADERDLCGGDALVRGHEHSRRDGVVRRRQADC